MVNKKSEKAGADDWVIVNKLVDHISVSYQNEENGGTKMLMKSEGGKKE